MVSTIHAHGGSEEWEGGRKKLTADTRLRNNHGMYARPVALQQAGGYPAGSKRNFHPCLLCFKLYVNRVAALPHCFYEIIGVGRGIVTDKIHYHTGMHIHGLAAA